MKGWILCWLGFHDWQLWKAKYLDSFNRCDYIDRCRRPGCEAERITRNYRRG